MIELLNAYRKYADQYYRKNGKPTGTIANIKPILKLVRQCYGQTRVIDFGPVGTILNHGVLIEGCKNAGAEGIDRTRHR